MFQLGRSIFLAFLGLTGTLARASSPDRGAVEIQIYDYADIGPQTLRSVSLKAESILARTGMSVQVVVCSGSAAVGCESQPLQVHERIAIQILAGECKSPQSVARPVLGRAVASQDGGTLATVFLQSVHDQAAVSGVSLDVVLAHVAAHEAGHLLLGTRAPHASHGLMKAHWAGNDYIAMSQELLRFTPEQQRILASRHGATATPRASSSKRRPGPPGS